MLSITLSFSASNNHLNIATSSSTKAPLVPLASTIHGNDLDTHVAVKEGQGACFGVTGEEENEDDDNDDDDQAAANVNVLEMSLFMQPHPKFSIGACPREPNFLARQNHRRPLLIARKAVLSHFLSGLLLPAATPSSLTAPTTPTDDAAAAYGVKHEEGQDAALTADEESGLFGEKFLDTLLDYSLDSIDTTTNREVPPAPALVEVHQVHPGDEVEGEDATANSIFFAVEANAGDFLEGREEGGEVEVEYARDAVEDSEAEAGHFVERLLEREVEEEVAPFIISSHDGILVQNELVRPHEVEVAALIGNAAAAVVGVESEGQVAALIASNDVVEGRELEAEAGHFVERLRGREVEEEVADGILVQNELVRPHEVEVAVPIGNAAGLSLRDKLLHSLQVMRSTKRSKSASESTIGAKIVLAMEVYYLFFVLKS